jgi:hypothetical protein
MKSTTVALGFVAGATAAYNHPRHFHSPARFYRRDNGTVTSSSAEVAAAQTTLTVAVTNYHTVISCAPTVTNCPANSNNTAAMSTMPASDLVTKVQTSVVDLYTTVCPVTAAESVSKSVVQAHSSGYIVGTTRAPGPVPTPAGPAPTGNAPKPGESVSTHVGTTDAVLTMTVGPSTAKSVITTTIKSTFTQKVTVTKSAPGAPKETSGNSPVPGTEKPGKGQPGKENNGGYPVAPKPSAPAGASGPEGTTTMTSTSTGTRTVTVQKPSTATQNAPLPTVDGKTPGGQTPSTKNPAGGEQCNCPVAPVAAGANCPAAVTVTVTAPASTVYMTAPAAAATSANSGAEKPAAPGSNKPSTGSDKPAAGSDKPAAGSDKPATGSNKPSTGSDKPAAGGEKPAEGDDECEAEDENVTVSQTATVVPYPTGASNGTIPKVPKPTGGVAMPTGGYPTRVY